MKYFFDIGLGEINEKHLLGTWIIEERFINKNKHEEIFLNCNNLAFFEDGIFKALHCSESSGLWTMIREVELIYNPQVIFFYEEKQIAKAIITRLFTDNIICKLTLYFSTGLELNLQKNINRDYAIG